MTTPVLSEYRLVARNTSSQSENRIHDDAVARQYGFRGGLVPGCTVYAYMTHPLVAAHGAAWLERGRSSVRFVKPVIDGEAIAVGPGAPGAADQALVVRNPAGEECAVLTARLESGPGEPPDLDAYPWAAQPAERPEGSRAELAVGRVMATPELLCDAEQARAYADKVGEPLPLYRDAGGFVHPGVYLEQANRALSGTVRVGPWIHVSSAVRHLSAARVGERLQTRGRVAALWERKGREMVELDLLVVALAPDSPAVRPVAHIRHAAIWKLPATTGG
jgi:acyl dehydratase